jgi:tetratricopeptide (TPR) repeat protein
MTMTGDLIGTLRYMSPEQALAKRVTVDHRTDIYSLGITLYELLTHRPAFNGVDREEVLRQIAFEEPTPLRKHNSAIPFDLATIIQKAIEKNPHDRYPTAGDLADDLRRFVASEPIRAKPPTLTQRAAKWSRRHSAFVASCVILLVLTTVGLTTAATLLSQAYYAESAERQRAQENLKLAWDTTNDMYVQVAEKWLADEPHMEPLQREFLLKALTFFEWYVEHEADTPSAQLEVATALRRAGEVYYRLGEFQKARAALEDTVRRLINADSQRSRTETREELAKAHYLLSQVLSETFSADDPNASAHLNQALRHWRALLADVPEQTRFRTGLATTCIALGKLLSIGRCDRESNEALSEARELCRQLVQNSPNDAQYYFLAGIAQLTSGEAAGYQKRHDEAIKFLKRAADDASSALQIKPRNPPARNLWCDAQRAQARSLDAVDLRDEARGVIRAAIEQRKRLADDFPNVPLFQKELGGDYEQLVLINWTDASSAYENVKLAIRHYKAAYRANPQDLYTAAFLADQYNHCLKVCDKLGLRDERRNVQREALKHLLDLLERPAASHSKRLACTCNR